VVKSIYFLVFPSFIIFNYFFRRVESFEPKSAPKVLRKIKRKYNGFFNGLQNSVNLKGKQFHHSYLFAKFKIKFKIVLIDVGHLLDNQG